jgi:hypothetical protein
MAEDQYRTEAKAANSQAENSACLAQAIPTEWRRLKRFNMADYRSGKDDEFFGR